MKRAAREPEERGREPCLVWHPKLIYIGEKIKNIPVCKFGLIRQWGRRGKAVGVEGVGEGRREGKIEEEYKGREEDSE